MSKELFTSERERATIEQARSFQTDFYNRQTELNEIGPNKQPTAKLQRSGLLPRTTDGKSQTR